MAYVLTSLSGNLISAASAGYAPTIGADVSAIASAYQVVSATATQLNAGTSYLTSINETPISAARAGNAANASLANSAWYDGTGRLISALPDEATVSSIASAYAESAASSKQDASAMSAYALSADVSGVIDTVSSNSASWAGGGVDSATVSAIASSYAESAASSKLDSSASSSFYSTANESGFITGLPIDISVRDLSASRRVRATATGEDLYGNFDYAGMYFRSGSNRPYNIGIDNTGANFYIATAKNGFERIYASSIQSWNGKLDGSASSSFYTTANESGFVDSAYVDSAVSSKADSSSLSSYALSSDVSGVIDTVSSNSASWAGGGVTGDYLTAKVGSGQATFSTAFQDEMEKRPSLVIAAERSAGAKMYPRMMVTDWNDTTGDTHSGMLLANAFEFYICPKSARGQVDPSGVVQSRLDASQLQFNVDDAVSSFTRSSEFTRSGMRLGLSGNSASWVAISGNGTSGGFITLDDGSGTSGRIVASSVGYWNSKLDGSASSSYYTTANESGFIDSAYVESQVSGKQDTLTFDWDADSAISSINGSALAGGGGGTQVQSDWTESSTAEPSYIQNKPSVFGILAGAGITITESASAITIATEIPTYNTTTDVGKVLQVTVSGLAWVSLS